MKHSNGFFTALGHFWHGFLSLPWKRIGLIALCSILALILIAMIFVTAYAEYLLGLIKPMTSESTAFSEVTLPSDFTGETIDPSKITISPEPDVIIDHPDILNIMLVGQDRRPGENYRTRSDAMILCTINKRDHTVTLTSFMRDLYVNIPDHRPYKMNQAYAWGGMTTLSKTMMDNFGVKVDSFIEVDFSGFKDAVNLLGGVYIELTAAEAEYMNTNPLDGVDSSGWNLKAGMQLLNGDQALAYSRIRYIGNADFGRTERQRKVLNAILDGCRNMDLLQLNNTLTTILPMISTNMSTSTLLGYASELLPILPNCTVVNQRIPIDGSYSFAWVGPLDVILADMELNRQFLIDTLLPN